MGEIRCRGYQLKCTERTPVSWNSKQQKSRFTQVPKGDFVRTSHIHFTNCVKFVISELHVLGSAAPTAVQLHLLLLSTEFQENRRKKALHVYRDTVQYKVWKVAKASVKSVQ